VSMVPRYVAWRLLYLHRQSTIWRFQQQTTGIINLKYRDYLRHRLAVADREEQQLVVEVLSNHEARVSREEEALQKLRLLKQGLMDDLLTGRVRVPVPD